MASCNLHLLNKAVNPEWRRKDVSVGKPNLTTKGIHTRAKYIWTHDSGFGVGGE